MKVLLSQEAFSGMLSAVVKAARPSLVPLLDHIVLQVADGTLGAGATTGAVTILSSIDAAVTDQSTPRVIVPGDALHNLVKRLPADLPITLEASPTKVVITAGSSCTQMYVPSAENFPALPNPGIVLSWTDFSTENFLDSLAAVKAAVCADPGRPHLMQVNVTADGKMQACDGQRMHQQGFVPGKAFQVPAYALSPLMSLLRDTEMDTLAVGTTDNATLFRTGQTYLVASTISAPFPDVSQSLMLPTLANNHTFTIDRKTLLGSLQRVRINADAASGAVYITLDKGEVVVWALNSQGSNTKETLSGSWTGPSHFLAFSHRALVDALSAYPGETCDFRLPEPVSSGKPGTVRLTHQEQKFDAVLMQIRN